MESNIYYDFNQICRLCLNQGRVMSAIFESPQENPDSLSYKIMTCLSLQVTAGDGLPALICHECLAELEVFYKFKERCQISDFRLRQYFQALQTRENNIHDMENARFLYDHMTDTINMEHHNPVERHSPEPWVDYTYVNPCPAPETYILEQDNVEVTLVVVDPTVPTMDENVPDEEWTDSDYLRSENESHSNFLQGIISTPIRKRLSTGPKQRSSVNGAGRVIKKNANKVKKTGNSLESTFSKHTSDSVKRSYSKSGLEIKKKVKNADSDKCLFYMCNHCGNRFISNDEMLNHMQVHSNEETSTAVLPYTSDTAQEFIYYDNNSQWSCLICNKSFSSKDKLNRHVKIHSNDKPFHCDICSAAFSRRDRLTRHKKTHSDYKPFSCTLCPVKFCRRDKLTRHITNHVKKLHHSFKQVEGTDSV